MKQEFKNKISEAKKKQYFDKVMANLNNKECIITDENNINLKRDDKNTNRKFMLFSDFKNNIINGVAIMQMARVTQKYLILFYSYVLQNKNIISKKEFMKEYESGVDMDKIAIKYKISRDYIAKLRDLYEIKIKGSRFIKRIKNETPLTEEAKQIIIGSVLGDGSITNGGYFHEKHSEKQKVYLEWKLSFLKNVANSEKSFQYYEFKDKRTNKMSKGYKLRTITHNYFYELLSLFYKTENEKRTKIIPKNMSEYLTPLSLAVWFMDDGCTYWPFRHGIKAYKNSKPSAVICTDCFSIEEINTLIDSIKNNFGLIATIHYHKKNKISEPKPRILFNGEETQKFFNIIKQYVHPELMYKINEEAYLKYYAEKIKEKRNEKQAN